MITSAGAEDEVPSPPFWEFDSDDRKGPLFRSLDREHHLTARRLHRLKVLAMIKRRAWQAGLPTTTCCHTFRATSITTYLQNVGTVGSAGSQRAHGWVAQHGALAQGHLPSGGLCDIEHHDFARVSRATRS